MAVKVISFHIVVVVFPVACAGVVGRIDIDRIDLAAMSECQRLQHMEVFAVDDGMEWLAAAALDLPGADKAGIDIVLELGHHDQIGKVGALLFRLVATNQVQPRLSLIALSFEAENFPKPLIALRGRSTRRQNANLVTLADRSAGQFD